uniref:Vacuolar protein sorting-associated protein 52 homolog n=2 Tax=Plectus sambesii TaxID=2011161 RepID=A0A914WYF7_9BILA
MSSLIDNIRKLSLDAGDSSERLALEASTSDAEALSQHLEDEFVQSALMSGMDLREYSKSIEKDLKTVERDAVKDYIQQADQLASLHQEISSCDKVLEQMEQLLGGFQADLGAISSDIQRLQEQSVLMNQRLKNRQAVRGELSQFVDDMVIPQSMIQAIFERQVTEREFLEQLHELQHKIQFIKAQEFKEAQAALDVRDVIEGLKQKAMEKIREWLIQKIYQFRKPLTNYQIPQNAMLKNRFFYEFLLGNERQVAKEIRDEYVDTLGKMFYSYFKTYASRLFRLQHDDTATKEDLLGAEDTIRVSGFFSSKPQVRNRATVFSLGQRINVLTTDLEAPLIVPHVAQQNNERFQFEALFRSLQFAMVDHASHEYLFLCDFFLVNGQSLFDFFGQIMGKAIANIMKALEEKIAINFDAISLQLCIQMCAKYEEIMLKRGVSALDGYWKNIRSVLWDRFDTVMHLHIESLRLADAKRLGAVDTRPHYIVRRYAEFTTALLVVSQHSGMPIDERLQALITRLQAEIEQLLAKMAAELKNPKEKHICLINNYDLVLSVLMERLNEDTRETSSFKELQQTQINRYVEEMLFPHFGALMNFVNECEPLVDQGHTELLRRYTEKVPNLVRSFSADWKKSIDQINQEVMRSFSNFKNGTNILQGALTQLIQYYHRFQKVLAHQAFANCAAKNELVNIHHIMVELKKYKPIY